MTGNNRHEKLRALFLAFIMVVSVVGMTAALGGSAAAAVGSGNSVVLGGGTQDPGTVTISESSAADWGTSGSATLVLDDPVTFNQTASDPGVYQTSSGSISNIRFVSDQKLAFDYSGINDGTTTEFKFGELYLNVPADTGSSVTGTATIGVAEESLSINTDQPTITLDGANTSTPSQNDVTVGAAGTSGGFSVDISAVSGQDGQIANGSTITLYANASNGVTFNESLTASDLTVTDSNDLVDEANISVSSDMVEIPVTAEFAGGNNIVLQGLQASAEQSADDSLLTLETTPTDALGSVTTKTSAKVDVLKPTVDLGDDGDTGAVTSIPVGANGGDTDVNTSVTFTAANQMAGSENITLSLNQSQSEVSFDKSRSTATGVPEQGDDNTLNAGFSNTVGTEAVSDITVTDDSLIITVNNAGDVDDGSVLLVDDVALNVSNAPADDTHVNFEATTEPTDGVTVTSSDADGDFVNLERPDLAFNGGNDATVYVDNDGITSSKADASATSALTISSDDVNGQISDATNVTVTFESGTGVTLDQSSVGAAGTNDDDSTIDVASDDGTVTVNDFTVYENSIEIELVDDGTSGPTTSVAANNAITIDDLVVNATATASNTSVSVTTNTSDSEVTTQVGNILVVSEDSPDSIALDVNNDGTTGDTSDTPTVDTTTTSAVYVAGSDVDPFGGADVNLEIVESPDGASGSLNTSTVTTASDGFAAFNFTAGDQAGPYKVNATIAGTGTGANFTYDAQSGSVASVTVESIEDGIAGASGDKGNAALWVNATDEFGNPVSSSTTATLTVDSADVSLTAYDSVTSDGQGDGTTDSGLASDGTLTIDDDGTTVIGATNTVVEDVTIEVEKGSSSDTGTVTFFSNIGQVDLALNQSTAATGDTVSADATIKQSDGTVITVPDLTVDFDDNSDANTSFPGGTADSDSATTDADGVASVDVNADQVGTSTIDAVANLKKGSAELTIEDPTLDVSTDVSEVTVGNETDVTVNVTYANNETAVEGATVNVTGAGVSVADQTTDANGQATVTLNATEAGDITVNATMSGTNAGSATISAVEADEDITVLDDPATNLDDDGQLEDVNGNSEFDIGDVQALYANQDSDAVQNNVDAFDFNNNSGIDIGDVQALYVEYQDSQ